MNNFCSNIGVKRTAIVVLLAGTIATGFAQGNGNNQPTGQAGGVTSVVVSNGTAQPVPTKDQNNAAYQPFHFSTPISTNGAFATVSVPVPAGKRLVIEQVSAEVSIWGTTGSLPSMAVRATEAGQDGIAWVPMTWIGEGDNGASYFSIQPVRLYGDGGTNVALTIFKSRDINHLYSGTVSGYMSITGHLVNVP